jgi:DNA-binding SARP family transcriptional activator
MPGIDDDVRIEVLGPVRAWRGTAELALGPAMQRTAFAMLALRAGQPVPRTELVSALWGTHAPASADGNIHTYVSGLRRSLDPGRDRRAASALLTSSQAGYTLRIAPDRVDATAFERLLGHARTHRLAAGAAKTVDLLDRALTLWRGDPLLGLSGPFADRERARRGEQRLTALEMRAEAVLELGEHSELAELGAELGELVREYPLRERLRELLMLTLYRSGQHAEALEAFRNARAEFVDELSVEPGAELQRLHAQILAQGSGRDSPPAKAAEPERPERLCVLPTQVLQRREAGVRRVFVGREQELARLRTAVDNVCDGRGGAVWLEGDFGVGKSELITTALADLPRPCQIGWTRAEQLSRRIPLQVMAGCLGIDQISDDPRRTALASALYGRTNTSSIYNGQDVAQAGVGQMLALLEELCAQAPLVLVVDDIQWADEASVLLWQRLVTATRQLPLLLIAAVRPVPPSAQLIRLRQAIESRNGGMLLLGPLIGDESFALAERLIGAHVGPGLRDLVERTTGNPLYITELIEALLREQALVTTDGVADLADSTTFAAPRTLIDTVRRHLDALSGPARETLRQGALLGTEFTVPEIAAVTGKRPSDLMAVFEEAVAAHVIVDAGTHLAFRHPLLRQAFYDGIAVDDRAVLHRAAAKALIRVGAPVTRIANQVAAASVTDPWMLQWLVDNHEAVSNRAPQLAADLLGRALQACPPADPRREVLAAAQVRVLFRLDRKPGQDARAALAIATDALRAAEMRAVTRFRRGDTEATAAADPSVPELWRRHQHLLTTFRRGGPDGLGGAETVARQALEMAAGDGNVTAQAFRTLWLVASIRRDRAGTHRPRGRRLRRRRGGQRVRRPRSRPTRQPAVHPGEPGPARRRRGVAAPGTPDRAHPGGPRPPAGSHCRALLLAGPVERSARRARLDDRGQAWDGVLHVARASGRAAAGRRGADLRTAWRPRPRGRPSRRGRRVCAGGACRPPPGRPGPGDRAARQSRPGTGRLGADARSAVPPMMLWHQWLPLARRPRPRAAPCWSATTRPPAIGSLPGSRRRPSGAKGSHRERSGAGADRYRRVGRVLKLGTALEDRPSCWPGATTAQARRSTERPISTWSSRLTGTWSAPTARLAPFGFRRSTMTVPVRGRESGIRCPPRKTASTGSVCPPHRPMSDKLPTTADRDHQPSRIFVVSRPEALPS